MSVGPGGWQYQQESVCSGECHHGPGGYCPWQVPPRPLQRLQTHLPTQGIYVHLYRTSLVYLWMQKPGIILGFDSCVLRASKVSAKHLVNFYLRERAIVVLVMHILQCLLISANFEFRIPLAKTVVFWWWSIFALQDSLGGNAKTHLVANVHPSARWSSYVRQHSVWVCAAAVAMQVFWWDAVDTQLCPESQDD